MRAKAALAALIVLSSLSCAEAQAALPPGTATSGGPQVAAPAAPPTAPRRPTTVSIGSIANYQGLRISDIQFRGETAHRAGELQKLLEFKAGDSLDKARLQSSLRRLYATGRFSDIQVEAQRNPMRDVTLIFTAEPRYFFGSITIVDPPKPPSETQLVNAGKLMLGEPYTPQRVQQAMERVQRVLKEHGWYRAKITESHVMHSETQQIDIEFRIEKGERARIGKVIVQGESGYTPDEVQDISDLESGGDVKAAKVDKALTRLRKKYQKHERLEAQVSLIDRVYHPDSNTVDFIFKINQGPTVDVHVEGARLRRNKLKKYVPVFEENAVDEDLLNEGRRNIHDHFQTVGYFDVDVAYDVQNEPQDNHRHVVYRVNKGEQHKLDRIEFRGNDYFKDPELRERIALQEAGRLLRHGRFSDIMLKRDIDSIKFLYQNNGFRGVKVSTDTEDDVDGKRGRMRVIFKIEEGPQTLVSTLKFQGNNSFSEDELRALLATDPPEGQPFSEFNMAQDRDSILNHYFNHGFPNASFKADTAPLENDPKQMAVVYTIEEGPRVFVDRVMVAGLNHTRDWVVGREINLVAGEPLSQSEMFESQGKLYDMGIFNQVDLAIQNPDGVERDKNVLFQIQEAKRYTFNFGVGLEIDATGGDTVTAQSGAQIALNPEGQSQVSPRVSFDVTRLNFRGLNHTIMFKSRLSRIQQRVLVGYETPRWFGREDLTLNLNAFFDTTRDVRTFSAERLEGSVQATQRWSKATKLLYRFAYRRVRVDPTSLQLSTKTLNDLPMLAKPVRIGMPSFTFLRDRRDDPLESRRGDFVSADIGMASNYFGSEASFGRLVVQQSTYHRLGHDSKSNWIFARSTRLGLEQEVGNDVVPLPERFFAGGGSSHRGFAINQAGPRDLETGFPLGGSAVFVNNFELRMPPLELPLAGNNVSPVVFYDVGNVFAKGNDILKSIFRYKQPQAAACASAATVDKCEFNFLAHAVGGGLRYRTPIGPVRVDVGYLLNPPNYPSRDVNGNFQVNTMRRVNFFFSIGQTF